MLKQPCAKHKPLLFTYAAWEYEAIKRNNIGMKQKQCPKCKRWLWRDEYGPGWSTDNTGKSGKK